MKRAFIKSLTMIGTNVIAVDSDGRIHQVKGLRTTQADIDPADVALTTLYSPHVDLGEEPLETVLVSTSAAIDTAPPEPAKKPAPAGSAEVEKLLEGVDDTAKPAPPKPKPAPRKRTRNRTATNPEA